MKKKTIVTLSRLKCSQGCWVH